jgi:hypothetical protein
MLLKIIYIKSIHYKYKNSGINIKHTMFKIYLSYKQQDLPQIILHHITGKTGS